MNSTYDFAYSVGLIRALENYLLNENEVERMMLAKNYTEAFKILNELDYTTNKTVSENSNDFQKILNAGLLETKQLLTKISPDKKILNIIFHQYDFHNIKTLIKAKLSGQTFEEVKNILNELGAININALKQFIFEEDQKAEFALNKKSENYIKKKIIKVQELFKKKKNDPQIIDLYLDQKSMKIIFNIARDSKNKFLLDYVKILIDLNNIRLFFRMKWQNKDPDFLELALLWNGNITITKFKEAYKKDLKDFPELMKFTAYARIIATGFKHYEEEKTFIFLEKEIENYLTEYIKKAKLVALGAEPLIAYFLAKKNNALIIRMIMIHKLNQAEPEEIKKRLRTLYH